MNSYLWFLIGGMVGVVIEWVYWIVRCSKNSLYDYNGKLIKINRETGDKLK